MRAAERLRIVHLYEEDQVQAVVAVRSGLMEKKAVA